jgi:hypothetical protein
MTLPHSQTKPKRKTRVIQKTDFLIDTVGTVTASLPEIVLDNIEFQTSRIKRTKEMRKKER